MREQVNIDRAQGDPLVFHIDLKWSLWSIAPEVWEEKAPQTFAHLKAGFEGAFDEHGDTLVIHTAPWKEIRFGTVMICPKSGQVTVEFRAEFDEDPPEYETEVFPLPETLDEFLAKVDGVEDRLLQKIG